MITDERELILGEWYLIQSAMWSNCWMVGDWTNDSDGCFFGNGVDYSFADCNSIIPLELAIRAPELQAELSEAERNHNANLCTIDNLYAVIQRLEDKITTQQAENERLTKALEEIDVEMRSYRRHSRTASTAVIMNNINYIVLRNLKGSDDDQE